MSSFSHRLYHTLWLTGLVVALTMHANLAWANAGTTCPSYPPVMSVSAVNIYNNSHSIADSSAEAANKQMLAPIDNFITYLSSALDQKPGTVDLTCPYGLLQQWAAAGALLQPPQGSTGKVDSVMIASALGFDILKFKMRGVQITPNVARWYTALAVNVRLANTSLAGNKGVFAKYHSNTYPWAGSVSALSALISNDPEALRFADEVWLNELAEIRADGTTGAEIAREGRALVYHQMAANGLLVLLHIRRALGRSDDPAQIAHLKLLLNMIGNSLCNPEPLAAAAGAKQEIPGNWGFRIPYGFNDGLLPESWRTCGPKEKFSLVTVEYGGGDTKISADAVVAAAHH